MKYFTVLNDNRAHTVLFLVRAINEKEALEKIAVEIIGAEKTRSGKWLMRGHRDTRKDASYDDVSALIKGEMLRRKGDRFEILEIDFDPETDCQEIFCSREKEIK